MDNFQRLPSGFRRICGSGCEGGAVQLAFLVNTESTPQTDYDVAIIGGGFSGAATAIMLKRALPDLRVLIVEKTVVFDRKVGESTSEVGGCFLTRVLGLTRYLSQTQITKHGLRMWFTAEGNDCMSQCSEIGAYYQVRLPTFQLERAELDQHLYEIAGEMGCEQWRPATIKRVDLGGIGANTLEAKVDGETRHVSAKWVVDASGKASFLAHRMDAIERLTEHSTNSMWARFRNVGDLDSFDLKKRFPCFAKALPSGRGLATNHLMGLGWWVWIIPLRNGDVSAGLTWDTRLFDPPEGAGVAERLQAHILSDPLGRELFGNAEVVEGDTRSYVQLGYYAKKVMDDGWVIIGDAAGFMDPIYSHGLDFCAHTSSAVVEILRESLSGADVTQQIADYDEGYRASYVRWFDALYRDKYYYLGDAELMWAAFLLDIAAYFIGPVRQAYSGADDAFTLLPYEGPIGNGVAKLMSFYNRRLAKIARKRIAAGTYGRKNLNHRMLVKPGFTPGFRSFPLFFKGIGVWLRCEVNAMFLRPLKMPTNTAA